MRTIGKRVLVLGLFLLLGGLLAVGQSSPAGRSHARSKTVQKSGEVEAGVEGGCLLVRDTRDHKLYNVLFVTGKKPNAGEEISFTGILSDGATTCMEGIAVTVTSWKPIKEKPAKATTARPK